MSSSAVQWISLSPPLPVGGVSLLKFVGKLETNCILGAVSLERMWKPISQKFPSPSEIILRRSMGLTSLQGNITMTKKIFILSAFDAVDRSDAAAASFSCCSRQRPRQRPRRRRQQIRKKCPWSSGSSSSSFLSSVERRRRQPRWNGDRQIRGR